MVSCPILETPRLCFLLTGIIIIGLTGFNQRSGRKAASSALFVSVRKCHNVCEQPCDQSENTFHFNVIKFWSLSNLPIWKAVFSSNTNLTANCDHLGNLFESLVWKSIRTKQKSRHKMTFWKVFQWDFIVTVRCSDQIVAASGIYKAILFFFF